MPTDAYVVSNKNPDNLNIPAGEWSFRNFDSTANPNNVFRTLGHCSEATGSWEVNSISKRDASRGTREKIAEAEISRDLTINITMDQWDPALIALACWGETAVKHIAAKKYTSAITVSPGDEVYLLTDDDETPAYNYKNLTLTQIAATAARVSPAVLDTMGGVVASTGTVKEGGAYTGSAVKDFYVRISKPNSVRQTITDAQFMWKSGLSGAWSTPITIASGTANTLEDGVTVTFTEGTAGQDFQMGDVFKIRAIPAGGVLAEGVDYSADEVDVQTGKVRFKTDASFGADTVLNVSYEVGEQLIPRVYASTQRKVEGELRFQSDPTLGRNEAIQFYHVRFAPTGDIMFIGEDFASQQISVSVLADAAHASKNNPNSKYFHRDFVGNTTGILRKDKI